MKYRLPVFILLLLSTLSYGQWDDSDKLPSTFHSGRRQALRDLMPAKSMVVVFANPVRNRSNDVDYQYSQNPDFYYLTGYLEPNSMLLLFKEEQEIGNQKFNEVLFVQERNPSKEIWTGKRLGVEGTVKMHGFKVVYNNSEFKYFEIPVKLLEKILVTFPDKPNKERSEKCDLATLVQQFNDKTASSKIIDDRELSDFTAQLREIKQPEELVLLRKAINISCIGFHEMIRAIQPGMTEYQAQAINEYYFKKYGSEYQGYPSICGGGNNSCVLHYQFNRKKLEDGDIFLVDMGAEYHGYTADVTRTVPVNGHFSDEQRAIYQLVYDAQEAGFAACKPGNHFNSTNEATQKVVSEGLLKLGIIKTASDFRKYFMHGTSHYLGLDVHDAGTYGAYRAGTVITVEPGIYIPEGSDCDKKWWKIGVRIEDDVLITKDGYEVLSVALPRSVPDIEKLMQEHSFFEDLNKDQR